MLIYSNAQIDGQMVFSNSLHEEKLWLTKANFYKFISVSEGSLRVEIDDQEVEVTQGEIISLSPLHHLSFLRVDGQYTALLFNSNFYCIHGNDHEVSCNGLLFHGSSHVGRIHLSTDEVQEQQELLRMFPREFAQNDHLQEEMLRIMLKRFIIFCTRIAEREYGVVRNNAIPFETIRRFMVLVDMHFREKKQVKEYADMLCKSPKTLSNLLADYHQPSAIKIIHQRIEAEARRLLLYTSKSSKDIALQLGFEDQASFARFFKKMTGLSTTEYRQKQLVEQVV